MSALILALNPSIDAETSVADAVGGEEQCSVRAPLAKGINVARWLKYLGGKPQLFCRSGAIRAELAGYLRQEKTLRRLFHWWKRRA